MAVWEELEYFIEDSKDPALSAEQFEEDWHYALKSLASYHKARQMHDASGFYAEFAWSDACLALGHERSLREDSDEEYVLEEDDELYENGTHERGWDYDLICLDTKYGFACTYCEGECDMGYGKIPSLWDMVRSK